HAGQSHRTHRVSAREAVAAFGRDRFPEARALAREQRFGGEIEQCGTDDRERREKPFAGAAPGDENRDETDIERNHAPQVAERRDGDEEAIEPGMLESVREIEQRLIEKEAFAFAQFVRERAKSGERKQDADEDEKKREAVPAQER